MDPILTSAGKAALQRGSKMLASRVIRPVLPSAGLAEDSVQVKSRIGNARDTRVHERDVKRIVRELLLQVTDVDPVVRGLEDGEILQSQLCNVLTVPGGIDLKMVQNCGLDPSTLSRHLVSRAEREELSSIAERVFMEVLLECCVQIIDYFTSTPQFIANTLVRQQQNAAEAAGRVAEAADIFERKYLEAIESDLDELQLFGLKLRSADQIYLLTPAYVSLSMRLTTSGDHEADIDRLLAFSEDVRSGLAFHQVLNASGRILLEGPAGSGKTTFLKRLALHSVRDDWPDEVSRYRRSIPFLISMRNFASGLFPQPEDFVRVTMDTIAARKPDLWVTRLLEEGRAILLIDGIDEVPHGTRWKALDWIRRISRTFPNAKIIVSSRPAAVDQERASIRTAGFATASIEPMTPAQVVSFVEQWHNERQRRQNHIAISAAQTRLQQALLSRRDLRRIATTPLLCAMLCALNLTHYELPKGRSKLYRAALEMLLEGRDQEQEISASDVRLDFEQSETLLARLAMYMLQQEQRVTSRVEALAEIDDFLPRVNSSSSLTAEAALRFLVERSGVLQAPAVDEIEFRHPSFQDFLAAGEFIRRGLLRNLAVRIHEPMYQDVIVMAIGQTQNDADKQNQLLEGVTGAASRAGTIGGWLLAAASIADLSLVDPDYVDRIERATRGHLPPRTAQVAQEIATAGGAVLDLLGEVLGSRQLDAYEVEATALALSLISDVEAIPLAKRLSTLDQGNVQASLVAGWYRSEDQDEYAREVLSGPFIHRVPLRVGTAAEFSQIRHMCAPRVVLARHLKGIDVAVLAGLSELEVLDLANARWNGELPLTSFPILFKLNLSDTGIAAMRGISECVKLQILHIGDTQIRDISELAGCTRLRDFVASGSSITNLQALSNHPNLRRIDVADTELTSIAPIVHSIKLREIDISATGVDDLSVLENCKELEFLTIDDCALAEVRPLEKCRKLKVLNAMGTGITGFDELGALGNLRKLDLSSSALQSLDGIERLKQLERLDISRTEIADLGPIAKLVNLKYLDVSYSNVVDVTALNGLPRLDTLILDGTGVSDIAPLRAVPCLKNVSLNNVLGNTANARVLWYPGA